MYFNQKEAAQSLDMHGHERVRSTSLRNASTTETNRSTQRQSPLADLQRRDTDSSTSIFFFFQKQISSFQTPKRPASDDDANEILDDTPRRKLLKINQENEEEKNPYEKIDDDDLTRKVEECFRNVEPTTDNEKNKSSTRRRSRFRFSFSNNHQSTDEQDKSRLFRTLSASIIHPENATNLNSTRRRKSYSTTGLANELKQTNEIEKKPSKTKSSLATRVKRAFFRPHRQPMS